MSLAQPREVPMPTLPDPVRTTNGFVACNEPLVVGGATVGYCQKLVKPNGTRWRRPGWHRGRHSLEWGVTP